MQDNCNIVYVCWEGLCCLPTGYGPSPWPLLTSVVRSTQEARGFPARSRSEAWAFDGDWDAAAKPGQVFTAEARFAEHNCKLSSTFGGLFRGTSSRPVSRPYGGLFEGSFGAREEGLHRDCLSRRVRQILESRACSSIFPVRQLEADFKGFR